jgi:hypothetical protein
MPNYLGGLAVGLLGVGFSPESYRGAINKFLRYCGIHRSQLPRLAPARLASRFRSRSFRKGVFMLAVANDQHPLSPTIPHDELESIGAGIDGDE